MKNKITDLNNHLFAQLERLGEEDLSEEALQKEISRAKAIADISKNIIESQKTALQAMSLMERAGYDIKSYGQNVLGPGEKEDKS